MSEMDEDIAKWILEFLLRQPIEERIVNDILSSVPLKNNNDNRLKKTLILRKIEYETSKGLVSEKILDLLEAIEELDHREGKTPPDLLKKAYCAVAVNCTVRFLEDNVENNAKYFEAVGKVWRDRVCKMESLLSEESNQWLEELEVAVCDSGVCEKILMRNTRYEALKTVRVYLTEAWGSLGPTFLEQVAEKCGNAVEGLRRVCDDGVMASANLCRKTVVFEESQKGLAPVRRKHVAVKGKRPRGVKISDADEGHEDETIIKSKCHRSAKISDVDEEEDESVNKASAAPTSKVDRMEAAVIPSSVEHSAAVRNNLPDPHQLSETLSPTKATENVDSNTAVENQTGPDMKETPEVERVREALKSSSVELHATVRDPLPDARESTENDAKNVEKKENPTQGDGQVQEQKDNTTQDAQGQVREQRKLRILPKPSLMEPNVTIHTFEWDNSSDALPRDSPGRPRLPSPKETKLSPLKKYEDLKCIKRRPSKSWSPAEEDALRAGVQKFGKGNWKLILSCFRDVFQERTYVDLKDKWRNMTKLS